MKKYRVNESEHFNLMSMHDHLKCIEIDMIECVIPWDNEVIDKLEDVEDLLDKYGSSSEILYATFRKNSYDNRTCLFR